MLSLHRRSQFNEIATYLNEAVFSLSSVKEIGMFFSLMFFPSNVAAVNSDVYGLLLQLARLADEANFTGIWTPERHFHPFGGFFPNPSITSAALAVSTKKIQIRAGSLISPLHNTIRIAEDWAMIDNLSKGRAALSFGPGWNINDFSLNPKNYVDRKKLMYEQITVIKKLWAGEKVDMPTPFDKIISLGIYPRPVQGQIPIWITSSGTDETFVEAGRRRCNILTHLIGQNLGQLKRRIELYREAMLAAGAKADEGRVTLMVHTFLEETRDEALAKARAPLKSYLRTALDLTSLAAKNQGIVNKDKTSIQSRTIETEMQEEVLEIAVERYLNGQSVIGSSKSVIPFVESFSQAGVDELACLVDFGLKDTDVVSSTTKLATLQRDFRDQGLVSQFDSGRL